MSAPHPAGRVAIPESLRLQLADFRRRLWRIKIIESVAAGVTGLLVSFLLVYGLDRVINTSAWARLAILVAGTSLFIGFAPYWIHRWVWRRRRESQIAQLIAKRYPGLGDRLLGVIELQDQQANAETLSPRLREAAMLAVTSEASQQSLGDALPSPRHRKWAAAALLLICLAAAAMIATPRAGINALQRWLLPLSDTQRYTFTRLDNPPTSMAVAIGEPFDVTFKLTEDSQQRPPNARGKYAYQPVVQTTLKGNHYAFTFPGQQQPGTITFHIGDLRHELKVIPMQRPAVEAVRAIVTPPAYLKLPKREVNLYTGALSAVEGSTLEIELEMTRPLDAASSYGPVQFIASEIPDAAAPPDPLPAAPLAINNPKARTRPLDIGEADMEIPFQWFDQHGLGGDPGFKIRVDAVKDAPPNCYLQGIKRQHLMLPEETIDFEVLAEDDYSLATMGIEWIGQHTRASADPPAVGELKLSDGEPGQSRMLEPVAFSPANHGISPQKILLRGWTSDHYPGRERCYSEPIVIYVLTRNEHAQIVKNQFERIITELEDLARNEHNLLEENQRLERIDGEQLQTETNRKRIEKQEENEAETQRRSKDLTERLEQVLKDSIRNGDIDKETLRKMAETLKSMQELSQQDVPDLQQQLNQANQPSNTPEKSEKDMKSAVEKQQQVIKKMQQAIDKANDAKKQFEAGTFAKRLRKAASEQLGITQSLKQLFSHLLGLEQNTVDPAHLTKLNSNTSQQSNTLNDVRWIIEDLTFYYARTQTQEFKQVLDLMRESDISVGLDNIRSLITLNHSYEAAEKSNHWGAELNRWAQQLEDEQNKGGSGGGGGGGGNSENEDFEFMLRVMKMIQTQQDLRARTRGLEQMLREHQPDRQRP